jgi:purine-nucleoside phosphorylase
MERLDKALDTIRGRDDRSPEIVLILGSGLSSLAESASDKNVIPGAEIPGYPTAGVSGHHGDLVIGTLAGKVVLFVRGRFHKYEGHALDAVTYPVRIAAGLGCRRLIVTNAAGSLHKDMPAGSLMRITDHINSTSKDPLAGRDRGVTRRRTPSPYDRDWGKSVDVIAGELGVRLHRGVYLWTLGPSYETPAEIKYFRRSGADAVGMSTVPEVTVANSLGLRVLGISAITNLAAGLERGQLSHDDVLDVGRMIHDTMRSLLSEIVSSLSVNRNQVSPSD